LVLNRRFPSWFVSCKEIELKISEKILVTHPLGLHLRGAAKLVLLLGRYKCSVVIHKGAQRANARSILGLVGLAAANGTELEFILEGDDAEESAKAIRKFFEQGLGETMGPRSG
jgi:phosphocarrier protein HPr